MEKLNKILKKFEKVKRQWKIDEDGFNERLNKHLHILADNIKTELYSLKVKRNITTKQCHQIIKEIEEMEI